MEKRLEKDSIGTIEVAGDKLWGAQTQRSFENFKIGSEKMPMEMVRAIAIVKKACALANLEFGKMDGEKAELISDIASKIIAGELDEHFPLAVWQTGSGTQTNMNLNEVIANHATLINKVAIHPNDHVNMSQSSNDVFPSAMCIAVKLLITSKLIPQMENLIAEFARLEKENAEVKKIGRTHLQDATPMTFGEEISGWKSALETDLIYIKTAAASLAELPIGGTAVGNGINAPAGFDEVACKYITKITGETFVPCANKFAGLASKNQMVYAHGAVKTVACDMMKIANDVRLLASGPRAGIGEIIIPANEPGSSIMPGKVNPTQSEAVTMVAVQIMGNDATIGFAASQGNFQLNVFMPVVIANFVQSVNLLSDVIASFRENCVCGIVTNHAKMQENLRKSLMLVTYFAPKIGYEKSAEIAKYAYEKELTLKEACLEKGYLSESEIDEILSKFLK
ncbi:MAG: class II fumarate hydratase [Bacillota bacterium]